MDNVLPAGNRDRVARINIYLNCHSNSQFMKKAFYTAILLVCPFILKAQSKVDSLLEVYERQKDIEAKVEILEALYEASIYSDSRRGKEFATEIISISEKNNYDPGIIIGHHSLAGYYFTIKKLDSATIYYNKTLDLAASLGKDTAVVSSLSTLSIIAGHYGKYREAIELVDSITQIAQNNGDYLQYGVYLNNNGHNYYELGEYLKAMNHFQQALKVLDTIDREIYRRGDVYRNIGKLNYQQKDHAQAIEYYHKANAIYEQVSDNLYSANVLCDIGNVYVNLKEYDEAIDYFEKSLEKCMRYNFPESSSNALFNLGIAYREKGEYERALDYFKRGSEVNTYDMSSINYVLELYHVGHTYSLKNEHKTALQYLDRSVALADSLKVANELKHALEFRSKAYENQGDYGAAFIDFKAFQKIKDSLFSLEKTRTIEELQTIYETEKKEAAIALQEEEIKTLNERAKVDKLTKGLYAGGMASALALSGLLVFGFRQRIKKNRIAREKQEEIYRKEIDHKKKELASQTLHLVQKNTFIQELMENLQSLQNSPDKFKMEFRRIVMLLKKENASDKDWEIFKTYFAEVHNDFDQKLKTLNTDISEKEIRLAAFLRMNLTTKEIAATMNVLPDSILKSKYRLKKKLGLDKSTDLGNFLNSL